jgi:hypothetical protein
MKEGRKEKKERKKERERERNILLMDPVLSETGSNQSIVFLKSQT